MKSTLKIAFIDTIPVLTGYLLLGFGFGIVLKSAGYGIPLAFLMSLFIFSGSIQYVAVGLLAGGASLVTVALTTLMVNARYLFYGISMLKKYKSVGKRKPYLIFALTDETYSLVCREKAELPQEEQIRYCTYVSALNHVYWVTGALLGAVVGTLVHFNSEGIDFVLTALFVTVFLEQWMTTKNHTPALIGIGASVVCLLIFGSESFLIPTMLVIALLLCLQKEGTQNA